MPLPIELPDEARLEIMVLSRAYRALVSKGDRNRPESVIGESVDPITGIVVSEADLLPANQAIRGRDYVKLGGRLDPDEMAIEHLCRDEDPGAPLFKNVRALQIMVEKPDLRNPGATVEVPFGDAYPSGDRTRAEDEARYAEKNNPGWKTRVVEVQGRGALTTVEAEAVAALKGRFSVLLHRFAERGWVVLEPTMIFESVGPENLPGKTYRRGVDDSGTVWCARWTDEGIDEAEKRCANDPYWSSGAFSSLEGQTEDVKNRAVVANPWAARLHKQEKQSQ